MNVANAEYRSARAIGRSSGGQRLRADWLRVGVYVTQLILDLVVIVAAFLVASATLGTAIFRNKDVLLLGLICATFVVTSFYARGYTLSSIHSYYVGVRRMMHAWLMTVVVVTFIAFASKQSASFSRAFFLFASIYLLAGLFCVRVIVVRTVKTRLRGLLSYELFIRDGVESEVPDVFDHVDASTIALKPDLHDPISLHNFSCLCGDYDRIVISCPPERREAWSLYLQSVGCVGELLIPELDGIALPTSSYGARLPSVRVSVGPLDLPNRVAKRVLDLLITIPLIILLAAILVVVAVAIKLDSRGPVLFRQQRMGRGNRLFDVYKFRSMRHETSDYSGTRSAARDDDRITRVGRIIRATSIDELPQLFNVLQGDMALVGPRPHALGSRAGADLFWHIDHRYWLRHSIKPGITGLAQVRGHRGATDSRDDLINRLHSDLEYVADWSIFRDLSILVRTVRVVIHKNAY